MTLEPALAAFGYTVTGADSVAALGSGEAPVLAIPRCSPWPSGLRSPRSPGALDAGARTVGTRMSWTTWPSPDRAHLEVEAVLEQVAGRRLQFAVRLRNGGRPGR